MRQRGTKAKIFLLRAEKKFLAAGFVLNRPVDAIFQRGSRPIAGKEMHAQLVHRVVHNQQTRRSGFRRATIAGSGFDAIATKSRIAR